MKPSHIHEFKPYKKTILLNAYKRSRGEVETKAVNTARDILKQRVCACGTVETYDLKRKVLHKP